MVAGGGVEGERESVQLLTKPAEDAGDAHLNQDDGIQTEDGVKVAQNKQEEDEEEEGAEEEEKKEEEEEEEGRIKRSDSMDVESKVAAGFSSSITSINRIRPVAKRDWPPGCGPRKAQKRQAGENGVAIPRQLQADDFPTDRQTNGCSDSGEEEEEEDEEEEEEDAMFVGASVKEEEMLPEDQTEVLKDSDMDLGETGLFDGVQNQPVAREKGGSGPRPVAMKSVIKRNPVLSFVEPKEVQDTKPVARRNVFKPVAQRGAPTKQEKTSKSDGVKGVSKAKDMKVKSGEDAKSTQAKNTSQPKKKPETKAEKTPEPSKEKKVAAKQLAASAKKDSNAKKNKGSDNSKPKTSKTPLQPSPGPLAEIADLVEVGETDIARFVDDPHDPEVREMVRKTLQIYEALRRKLGRDEEFSKQPKSSHLKAQTLMNEKKISVNRVKKIGYVPGVEIGDHYYFRAELCVVGLHRQIQGGIDYISTKEKENEWGHLVTASITASGGYEDDIDDGETLIYSGQGGNAQKGDKRQQEDQKLERGNLSLENSRRLGLPVRVIRGCKDKSSPTGTIYTYDGLYLVKEMWLHKGTSGFGMYKFKLQRIPGQAQLGSAMLKFMGELKSNPSSRQGMIMADISKGQEKLAVCVVNEIDDETPASDAFQYATSVTFPEGFELSPVSGCDCKKSCSSSDVCECIRENRQKAPYISGVLVEAKDIVFECGLQCGCSATCQNRVAQHGIKHRLEIFKTELKGWGVRSWDCIPSGSFVCEYVGEIIDTQTTAGDDEYLLDFDLIKGNKSRGVDVSMFFDEADSEDIFDEVEDSNLAIDASKYGNVGRFINHSCSPNLLVQCVLFDHHDVRTPHIMLFAKENIPPFTELTYDYGYTIGQVMDEDGESKTKVCHCGSKSCRGRIY